MSEPHIQLDANGVYLVFPIDSAKPVAASAIFTPQTSVNITPPEYTPGGRVQVEIFLVQAPGLSFSVFKRECYVPNVENLNVLGAQVLLGKQTRIFFPKR